MGNNTKFLKVYKRFLSHITDYLKAGYTDVELEEFCFQCMMSAIPKIRTLKNNLNDYNEELKEFNNELIPEEIEALALQMVSEWVTPQLYNTTLTAQYFGTLEDKFYAQSTQIAALKELRETVAIESRKIRTKYGYAHNDFFRG